MGLKHDGWRRCYSRVGHRKIISVTCGNTMVWMHLWSMGPRPCLIYCLHRKSSPAEVGGGGETEECRTETEPGTAELSEPGAADFRVGCHRVSTPTGPAEGADRKP